MQRPYFNDDDAIVTAAYDGDSEAIAYLLDRGTSIEARNEHGCTALMAAVDEGYVGLVEFLVEKGADVNAADAIGDTPLAVARYSKHGDLVRFLEARGATAPIGPSARERRDDLVYSAFDSVDAARRLVQTTGKGGKK